MTEPSFEDPSVDTAEHKKQVITFSEFKHEIDRQKDIYEDEIILLNEELEHVKQVGGTIIEEYRRENFALRELLQKAGIEAPQMPDELSHEKLT